MNNKSKKLKIFEWVFSVLSFLALIFTLFWFIMIIFYSKQESNLGTGLSIAISIIFDAIGSIVSLVSSIVGIIFYFIVKKKDKTNQNKGLLITNVAMIVINIVLFSILLILV